jgi:P-type Ca2+ transporter type 2C
MGDDARTRGRPRPHNPPWHTLDHATVVRELGSHATQGLSQAEATSRLAAHGKNVLETRRERRWPAMLAAQFTDFMILVLLGAALIAGLLGEAGDAIVILVIVVLNAIIGFVQELRAERAMAALRRLAPHNARVIRDGAAQVVEAPQLVPGDVVWLEAGDVVPADVRLIEVARLQTEEAALTGESLPVEKGTEPIEDRDAPLGDRSAMVYKGTLITHGRGRGVVVATGMRTELGRIATLLTTSEGQTPLQRRLAHFGYRLALAVLAVCALLFVVGWLHGEPIVTMFLTAVSLAVAAIPESLPAVVTIALALGAARMVRKSALIRRLPAVETLGSVTFICADKTGTLTENRMRLETAFAAGMTNRGLPRVDATPWRELGMAMALCNDARRDGDGRMLGEPTEAALLAAIPGEALAAWTSSYARVAEVPFDSHRARMSTLHRDGGGALLLVKGAPESVLPRCTLELTPGGPGPLTGEAERAVQSLATEGQRVLAFAMKPLTAVPGSLDPETLEQGLILVGLAGLIDPPRAGVAEAVAACRTAGITPVMITGDHAATARAVATRLGIIEPNDRVLTGPELARLSDAELATVVSSLRVYARTSPEQKIRIVDALQARGELVAMTGDGVNDAPALKRADIGVAMGRIGTDVAREAAAMVLLDDDFATIVAAVREGRRIFDNIRKFVRFVMGGNCGELCTLFVATLIGLPVPLLPMHILWVNLVTDGLPGLALAAERAEPNVMQRPPRPPRESIFARGLWQHIVWVGLLIGALCIGTQTWAIAHGHEHWQSMVFTVLTLSQMAQVLAVRSERQSLLSLGIFSNLPLLSAVLLTFGLQLMLLYVPLFQAIFHTAPLSLAELAACVLLSATVLVAVELEKGLTRRGWLYRRRGR